MSRFQVVYVLCTVVLCWPTGVSLADDVKQTELYARIKRSIDSVSAIDTHDHLHGFNHDSLRVRTPRGNGWTLYSLWSGSYFSWNHSLTPWPTSGEFGEWWPLAKHDFDDARAASFYRYMLPAFRDLYGVDFDTITDEQAKQLSEQIFDKHRDSEWPVDVITRRANIELMFIDPYCGRG